MILYFGPFQIGQSHPTGLTNNLLKLFEPRAPLEYKPPPEKRKCPSYTGVYNFSVGFIFISLMIVVCVTNFKIDFSFFSRNGPICWEICWTRRWRVFSTCQGRWNCCKWNYLSPLCSIASYCVHWLTWFWHLTSWDMMLVLIGAKKGKSS